MKGVAAHSGAPEAAYGNMVDKLVRAGYKVARVKRSKGPRVQASKAPRAQGPRIQFSSL